MSSLLFQKKKVCCFVFFVLHGAVDEMVASPAETRSDSFYFADGKLIMHNRAEYSYTHISD